MVGQSAFAAEEARIRKEILECKQVTREIIFSSTEAIKNLRVEQEMRLNNTVIEHHNFRFGFVIPGSTNTWEQTFIGADEGRIQDSDILSGNLEILTTFCDGTRLIKRLSLIVYYV
jgi:retinal rod rhodopsin-sensitive cGMP 3',5'-cyclic phosphodiesterase subunit delta